MLRTLRLLAAWLFVMAAIFLAFMTLRAAMLFMAWRFRLAWRLGRSRSGSAFRRGFRCRFGCFRCGKGFAFVTNRFFRMRLAKTAG